jgi:hypothetical protein
MPGTDRVPLPPSQWKLIQLFDGEFLRRVAATTKEKLGARLPKMTSELASYLQTDTQLMYKTAVERNITLQRAGLADQAQKSQVIDFSDIVIRTWHNADGYISRLYPKVRFLITPWFVWTTVGMFLIMGWMWADRLGEIWSTVLRSTTSPKSGQDLIEFWFLLELWRRSTKPLTA